MNGLGDRVPLSGHHYFVFVEWTVWKVLRVKIWRYKERDSLKGTRGYHNLLTAKNNKIVN